MYAGAFSGFAVAFATGSCSSGCSRRSWSGWSRVRLMGFLTVTLGANQHVSGLGLTIVLIGLAEFVNRLLFTGIGAAAHRADAAAGTRSASSAQSGRCSASTG